MSPHHISAPRHPSSRTSRTLEDTGAHLPQLLVATDVPLHWPICENMRPLSPDQDSTTPSNRRASPAPNPGEPLGCHQCGFHCGTSSLAWVRRSHECGGLGGEVSTLHSH